MLHVPSWQIHEKLKILVYFIGTAGALVEKESRSNWILKCDSFLYFRTHYRTFFSTLSCGVSGAWEIQMFSLHTYHFIRKYTSKWSNTDIKYNLKPVVILEAWALLGFCCWIFVTACLASQNCKWACHAVDTANYEVSSPKNTTSANQGAIIFYCCLIYPASFF